MVETPAGVKKVELVLSGALATAFTVDMGTPRLLAEEIPVTGFEGRIINRPLVVDDAVFNISCVSMGNPHCVIFVDSLDDISLSIIGPKIEAHSAFPRKTNVEFVQVISENEMRVRVWERGAGMTLACGTGACASLVSAVLNGKTGRMATVHLPGGDLEVEWAEHGDVYMTGPAEEVFTGKYHT
jgi:diaminopimelate epimerase